MKKAKKKQAKGKPAELGLTGPGAEPLVIEEIEKAADKYADANNELLGELEAVIDPLEKKLEEAETKLSVLMHKHSDRLVKDEKGNLSYRYGDRLVTLSSSKERVKVKTVHDEVPTQSGD